MILVCSLQTFKTIWKLKWMLRTNDISWDLGLRLVWANILYCTTPLFFLLCIRMYPIHKGNCQSYPVRNRHCEWWPGYHMCEMYFVISEHIIWGSCNKKYSLGTHFKLKPGQTRRLNRFEWSMKWAEWWKLRSKLLATRFPGILV